jgi:hypothetical protein
MKVVVRVFSSLHSALFLRSSLGGNVRIDIDFTVSRFDIDFIF